ncbi:MAG: hypothetical protein ABUL62_06130 [Myxococcales bacterium]|jgi:hypothetical protein
MTPDPIDEFGARLFEAARREQPPSGLEQRLLAGALREARAEEQRRPMALRRGLTTGAAVSVVLLAAGIALQIRSPKPNEPISAEPAVAHSASPKSPLAAESAPSASARPAPTSVPSIVKPTLTAPLPSASAAVTLSDELDALKVASTALAAGDAPGALAALDRYDHVLKGSKLRAEATLLRIQALARAGNAQAASALAQRFVDQNPDSPLVDRARSFIQTTGLGGN